MKALTICQPFAALIMLSDDDDQAKRVENRTWETLYRGPLLIHAGKSRSWLEVSDDGYWDTKYHLPLPGMAFGAIVGVCQLSACVHSLMTDSVQYKSAMKKWPWLAWHEHAELGGFWWILRECRRFAQPIPYRGQQGLFDVPNDVVREAMEAVR